MWSLTAAGEALTEEAERELHRRISEILASPEYRVTTSGFVGAYVNGPAHIVPEAAASGKDPAVTARASRAAATEGVHET